MKQNKSNDYLELPRDFFSLDEDSIRYYQEIRRLLLKEAGSPEMARLICFPWSRPEWWVRIYEKGGGGTFEVQVAQTEAWFPAVLAERGRGALDKMRIRRWQAPLEPDIARQVHLVWRRAILSARYPPAPPFLITTDGESYVLDCLDKGDGAHTGNGHISAHTANPLPRSLPHEMMLVAQQLKDYAQAAPGRRLSLLPELQNRLNRLTERQKRLEGA